MTRESGIYVLWPNLDSPTEHFEILGPLSPSTEEFSVVQKRRSRDFRALKLKNVR